MPARPTSFLARRDRARILYVILQREYAGAEVFAAAVMRADADPLLACPPGSPTEELAARLRVPTVPLTFRALRHSGGRLETVRSVVRGLAGARELRRVLKANPDRRIVYGTSLRPGMLAVLAAAGLGRRVVWVVTDFLPPRPLRQAVRALARLACDRAAATSRVVGDDYCGSSRRLRARTDVVYPGVSVHRFTPAAEAPAEPRAVIVGGVSPTKRTDLAVDIAARVGAETEGFELHVLGRAQYRPSDFALEAALERRVQTDPRLGAHVRFLGHTSDVASSLTAYRLLLHCRPDEPFGVAIIEAMACGLPVVAPRAAGPLEIVDEGVTGLLYQPGDVEEAAHHVIRLIRDPDEARRMGAAGRARVQRLFSEEGQVHAFDALLASVAAAP